MERFEGFTAVYEPTQDGRAFARVPEATGAFGQGRDTGGAREMLRDAPQLKLEANREEAEKEMEGREGVPRETLRGWGAATAFGISKRTAASSSTEAPATRSTQNRVIARVPVPRHDEISNVAARAVCDQLGGPHP